MSAPGSYMLILRVREQPVEPGLHQALAARPQGRIIEVGPPAQVPPNEVVVLQPYGSLFFAAAAVLESRLLALSDASRNSVVILRLAPVNIYAGDEPTGAAMQHACADALRWRSDPRGSPSSGVPMLLCGSEGDRHQNCRGNAARNPMPAHSRTRASPLIAVWTARAVNLDARPANSRVDANNTVRST